MKTGKSEPIKTVLTIVVGFGILFLATHLMWFLYVALIVGAAGLVSNYMARIIDLCWMKLAYVLSFIVPNILLTVVFYFFLFPLASLSKISKKKDPLMLSNKLKSTFCSKNKKFTAADFEKPW